MKTPVKTALPTDIPGMATTKKKEMGAAIKEANDIRAMHRKAEAERSAGRKNITMT